MMKKGMIMGPAFSALPCRVISIAAEHLQGHFGCLLLRFLLALPAPVAMTRSPMIREVSKRFSWSGPVSEINR